jgi:hypothetical protein
MAAGPLLSTEVLDERYFRESVSLSKQIRVRRT